MPIYLASKGFDVTAIDIAPTALSQAREKADRAGVKVRWLLANVLSLPKLEPFEFIFDRGCYHEVRFDNAPAYVETVRRLSLPGRTRFLLLAGNPNEAPCAVRASAGCRGRYPRQISLHSLTSNGCGKLGLKRPTLRQEDHWRGR